MRFLDPRNDVAFKKLFGSDEHKNITISFLNSILEYSGPQTIIDVQFFNTEQHPLAFDKKDNILDVMCSDQSGNRYIVEMQVAQVKEFGKRMVYYGAKTYALQLGKGKPYHILQPVIVVAIVDFIMFPDKQHYKSMHQILDTKSHEHDLPELSFAFVELKKFCKQEHELISVEDKWLYLLRELRKQDHIPAPLTHGPHEEACHILERMTWSEDALNAYDDAFVRATDEKTSMELAHEKGMAQGIAQGLTEGIHKGAYEKSLNIAREMLKKNIAVTTIAEITGLSEHDIIKLT